MVGGLGVVSFGSVAVCHGYAGLRFSVKVFSVRGGDNLEKEEDFFGERGREGVNARLTLAGFWVLLVGTMGVRGSKVRLDEVAGVAVLRIPEVVTEGGSEG